MAKIWFGRQEAIVRSVFAVAIDHVVKITAVREPEALVEGFVRALRLLLVTLRRGRRRRIARSQPASSCSALYQSALISTAFPRRGVTTQSPIFASIQVS